MCYIYLLIFNSFTYQSLSSSIAIECVCVCLYVWGLKVRGKNSTEQVEKKEIKFNLFFVSGYLPDFFFCFLFWISMLWYNYQFNDNDNDDDDDNNNNVYFENFFFFHS